MGGCGVVGCDRDAAVKGMCRKHYMRQMRKGATDDKRKNARRECSETGCGRLTAADGLCDTHYRRARYQPVRHEGRTCEYCSAPVPPERKANAKYCSSRCKLLSSQPARARRYQLKTKYGLTEAAFNSLLAAQGGCCAICKTMSPMGRGQRFHVDHNHKTGAIRGLLCSDCNIGLGKFRDDPELLRRALSYLTEEPNYTP